MKTLKTCAALAFAALGLSAAAVGLAQPGGSEEESIPAAWSVTSPTASSSFYDTSDIATGGEAESNAQYTAYIQHCNENETWTTMNSINGTASNYQWSTTISPPSSGGKWSPCGCARSQVVPANNDDPQTSEGFFIEETD